MKKSKIKRKALSSVLVLCMILSLFAGMTISASADESGSSTNISTLSYGSGAYRITSSGCYYLDSTISNATVLVQLPDSDQGVVEICGDGISSSDVRSTITIDCDEGTHLRLKDLYIQNSASGTSPEHGGTVASGASAVRFAGSGNTLDISGNVLIESTSYVTNACIAVNTGTELEITGSDTSHFYMYKYSQGCGIGADANTCNGKIIITSGNIFIKGSKTGALIGNDAGEVTTGNGDIIINGGNINLVNKAQGAAIGGSRLSYAGNVYVNGGNVSIATDYSAPAIGAGAQKKSIDGANGNLIISGGSLKTMIMDNAYSSWGVESTAERHTVSGTNETYVIDNSTITAAVTDRSQEAAALYELNDSSVNSSNNVVTVDGQLFYTGGIHQYEYSDSTLNGSGTTMSNWQAVPATDSGYNSLYLYLTKENHLLTINGRYYKLTWNAASASFSKTAVESVRVGSDGCSSISQAASVLGSSEGVIEITEPVTVSGTETISLGEGQYIARGYNVSGNLITVNSGADLTLSSGTIFSTAGNTSTGSLVYVNGGSFTMNGGALLGNHAANGGAIYAATGTVSVNGGVISGNTADSCGDGIYSAADINIAPSGLFELSDTVYLTSDSNITVTGSLSSITGVITIEKASASSGTTVAAGTDSYTIDNFDVRKLTYKDGAYQIIKSGNTAVLTQVTGNSNSSVSETAQVQEDNDVSLNLLSDDYDYTFTDGARINESTYGMTFIDGTEKDHITIGISGTVSIDSNIILCGYVDFIGIGDNATLKAPTSSGMFMYIGGGSKAYPANVTFNNLTMECKGSNPTHEMFQISYSTLTMNNVNIVNYSMKSTVIYDGIFAICDSDSHLILNNCNVESTSTIAYAVSAYNGGFSKGSNRSVVLKNCNLKTIGINLSNDNNDTVEVLPTGDINVDGAINADSISVTPQEGYPIKEVKVNGEAVSDYSTITGVTDGFSVTLQDEESAPTFAASLANVTAGPVAKGETFTADVVLTSDTVPASAALDLNVNSDVAKIVSITPAEGIGTTESTVATDGASGKVSFYGNTASAADGLKVATVTFEAVADGTADISLASEGAGVSGDPADYDITVPESATEVVVKSPTVEAVDFGGSYQLVKYTPNAPIAEGMTVKYGDQEMYLADGSWYCVKADNEAPSLASVSVEEGTQTTYTTVAKGDVNENGKINIVDAQIAYDIANSVYTGFEKLSVTGVLKADVNNSLGIEASDARAIQVYVHTGAFGN